MNDVKSIDDAHLLRQRAIAYATNNPGISAREAAAILTAKEGKVRRVKNSMGPKPFRFGTFTKAKYAGTNGDLTGRRLGHIV